MDALEQSPGHSDSTAANDSGSVENSSILEGKDIALLQGGIYLVRCFPGPDFDMNPFTGMQKQLQGSTYGHVEVPDIATLMEWQRVGHRDGWHTAWHPARSCCVKWANSEDSFYYRCGDALCGNGQAPTSAAAFDISYDRRTGLDSSYDRFAAVMNVWKGLGNEFARQLTGAILGRAVRVPIVQRLLRKQTNNDAYELAVREVVLRVDYNSRYTVRVVGDGSLIWEEAAWARCILE